MQLSAATFRMHAACAVSPLRVSSTAWTTRRMAASRGSRTIFHAVQAAAQGSPGEDPSAVNVKETSPPKSKGQSPAEQSSDHSADANISKRDPEADASVKQVKEGQSGADGAERQKKAEKMMDDAEGAGGHGYS